MDFVLVRKNARRQYIYLYRVKKGKIKNVDRITIESRMLHPTRLYTKQ